MNRRQARRKELQAIGWLALIAYGLWLILDTLLAVLTSSTIFYDISIGVLGLLVITLLVSILIRRTKSETLKRKIRKWTTPPPFLVRCFKASLVVYLLLTMLFIFVLINLFVASGMVLGFEWFLEIPLSSAQNVFLKLIILSSLVLFFDRFPVRLAAGSLLSVEKWVTVNANWNLYRRAMKVFLLVLHPGAIRFVLYLFLLLFYVQFSLFELNPGNTLNPEGLGAVLLKFAVVFVAIERITAYTLPTRKFQPSHYLKSLKHAAGLIAYTR